LIYNDVSLITTL